MLRFVIGSIAIALAPFVAFFAFWSFISSHPSAAQATSLWWGKVAYYGRAEPFLAECARYDPRLTYLLRPRGHCRFDGVEFSTEIDANSFGLRDDEASLTKPEIIALGDSHTMGHGVEGQEAYPQVLERLLGRKVLDAGIDSYGTARELMLLRLLDTSAARVIIIQYAGNDLEENQAFLQHGGKLPIRSEEEYETLVRRANASYVDFLGPGFRVLQRLTDKVLGHHRYPEGVKPEEIHAKAFRDVLAKSADLLRGRHVVVIRLAGWDGPDARFVNAARSLTADLGLDLTFVDVTTVLTAQDFFVLDPHMHPSGHRKVAALLAQIIGPWLHVSEDAEGAKS